MAVYVFLLYFVCQVSILDVLRQSRGFLGKSYAKMTCNLSNRTLNHIICSLTVFYCVFIVILIEHYVLFLNPACLCCHSIINVCKYNMREALCLTTLRLNPNHLSIMSYLYNKSYSVTVS